ncbi:6192_t:CDS:2 [Paraglomus occultum]|uniref:6192_t:CDS:1 n=1 Tax=Paraglomus occultum TaxID=144539 RepID=A0A9N8VW85_9GLOM|nr:6192_t:CDS:2 [Paraglomus occultum]
MNNNQQYYGSEVDSSSSSSQTTTPSLQQQQSQHNSPSQTPQNQQEAEQQESNPAETSVKAEPEQQTNESPNSKDSETKKKRAGPKRRKVTHACVYCRRSHMTCDDGRPCQRCIKRSIGHLCHDEPKGAHGAQIMNQPPAVVPQNVMNALSHVNSEVLCAPPNIANVSLTGYNPIPSYSQFPTAPLTFASEHMGNEFTVITDFLESANGHHTYQHNDGTPVNTTEKFFLIAADPSDGTSQDRLMQVITAKFEAGLLKPYNYVHGYARLQKHMESYMSSLSRQRIVNSLGKFRPHFRAVAQSLTDMDLVLVEEAFERLLLDYDRVFSSMGIPACLWRRSGEIYKGNEEFAKLIGVPTETLREGRMCIYELMAEDSAVNYWEKYGNIAFDPGQKAVLTSCILQNPDPEMA